MKKLIEFKNAPADMLLAIDKLNNLAFTFLENTDEFFEEETRGNKNAVVYGNTYYHPGLFAVTKKTDILYFVKCQFRSKTGGYYNFELNIDITNDDLNQINFENDYYDD